MAHQKEAKGYIVKPGSAPVVDEGTGNFVLP